MKTHEKAFEEWCNDRIRFDSRQGDVWTREEIAVIVEGLRTGDFSTPKGKALFTPSPFHKVREAMKFLREACGAWREEVDGFEKSVFVETNFVLFESTDEIVGAIEDFEAKLLKVKRGPVLDALHSLLNSYQDSKLLFQKSGETSIHYGKTYWRGVEMEEEGAETFCSPLLVPLMELATFTMLQGDSAKGKAVTCRECIGNVLEQAKRLVKKKAEIERLKAASA